MLQSHIGRSLYSFVFLLSIFGCAALFFPVCIVCIL